MTNLQLAGLFGMYLFGEFIAYAAVRSARREKGREQLEWPDYVMIIGWPLTVLMGLMIVAFDWRNNK